MAQWVMNPTTVAQVSAEAQIRSWHSGLKTGSRGHCGSDSVPGLGTSVCHACSHKGKNKTKQNLKSKPLSSISYSLPPTPESCCGSEW